MLSHWLRHLSEVRADKARQTVQQRSAGEERPIREAAYHRPEWFLCFPR